METDSQFTPDDVDSASNKTSSEAEATSIPSEVYASGRDGVSPGTYFRDYLRRLHPEWTDGMLQSCIDTILQSSEALEALEIMEWLERGIRREDPAWKGGWGLPK
jgi:hypothetical protein